MEDYQQDAPQKPSTKEPKPLLTFWRLIVFCALLAVAVAVGLPYYLEYSRTNCDRAASNNAGKAGAVIERLVNELVDMNMHSTKDEGFATIVDNNALRYLVGPYYGFRGGTRECRVLFRIAKVDNEWQIQATALNGSRPAGPSSRYVYHAACCGDFPAQIVTGIVDARNGKTQDWNAIPYRDTLDEPEICYTESVVDFTKKPLPGHGFAFRVPKGIPCDQIEGSRR